MAKAENHCYREKTRNYTIISLKIVYLLTQPISAVCKRRIMTIHKCWAQSRWSKYHYLIRKLCVEEGWDRFASSRIFLRALSALFLKGSHARGTTFSLADHLHYFIPPPYMSPVLSFGFLYLVPAPWFASNLEAITGGVLLPQQCQHRQLCLQHENKCSVVVVSILKNFMSTN